MMRSPFLFVILLSIKTYAATPTTNPAIVKSGVRGDEITKAQKWAVTSGLERLAKQQGDDGGYGGSPYSGQDSPHAGITALAGLAFMQSGSVPRKGKYGDAVQGCLEFVLASSHATTRRYAVTSFL